MRLRLEDSVRKSLKKSPTLYRLGLALVDRFPGLLDGAPNASLRQMDKVFASGLSDGGDFDRQMALWLRGVNRELRFWLRVLLEGKEIRERFGGGIPFAFPGIAPLLHSGSRVLDCGAALASSLGDTLPNWERIDLVPADPLAPFYDALLAGCGETPYARTTFGTVEILDDIFPPGSFDMACMCNALDHSCQPLVGIKQLLNMVPKGGHVFLAHIRNVAEREGYRGFHQWNLDADGGRFIVWNKAARHDVNGELQCAAEITVETSSLALNDGKRDAELLTVLMRKATDDVFDLREEKARLLGFLVRALGAIAINRHMAPFQKGLIGLMGEKAPSLRSDGGQTDKKGKTPDGHTVL